jgi:hypothetical protein
MKKLLPVLTAASLLLIAQGAQADLVGLWRFDVDSDTQVDSSSYGNTALVENTEDMSWAFNGTRNSGVMSFDNNANNNFSSNGRLSVADSVSLSITGNITIAAWVYMDQLGSGNQWRAVATKDPVGSNVAGSYQFWFNQPNSLPALVRGNGDTVSPSQGIFAGTTIPTASVWQHWAVTQSGSTVTFYLNGVATESGSLNVTPTMADGDGPLWIGDRPGTTEDMSFDGLMDDVAIFNQALNQSQIQSIMNGDFTAFGVIPEPGTAGLLVLAAVGTAAIRRRR